MPTTPYNVAPAPLAGEGVFGKVPGLTDLPSPATDLAAQIPGLAGTNAAAIADINAKLGGSISPGTMKALQDAAATFGAKSGMFGLQPGSLGMNNLFGNIVGFAENQAQQGLQDYNQFVPTVSSTQTVSPALQAQIATSNAVNRAAPSPSAAGSHAEQLFNKYLNALRGGPGGGPGGGTRMGGGGGGGGARDLLGFPIPGGGTTAEPGIFVGQSRSGAYGLGNAGTGFDMSSAMTPMGSNIGPGVPYSPGASPTSTDWTDITGGAPGGGGVTDFLTNPLNTIYKMWGLGDSMLTPGTETGTPGNFAGAGTFRDPVTGAVSMQLPSGEWDTTRGAGGTAGAGDTGLTDEEWAAITGG